MRILLIGHTVAKGDGQGRINFEIVKYCLSRGHSLTIVADECDPMLKNLGAVLIRPKPLLRIVGLAKVRMFFAAANRYVAAHASSHDVVVGNGASLTVKHDVNLCQFVHGAWIRSPVHVSRVQGGLYGRYQWLYSHCNRHWEQIAYKSAKYVVAPSEQISKELESVGVPSEKIRRIFNGVDLTEFRGDQIAASRLDIGLPSDVVLALFVGDIRTTRKNLDSVLEAMVMVPNLHLAIVGSTDRSPFPALAKKLGISERVYFLGFRSDVNKIMVRSDFFVFPSRYEAGSLVLMEAMASGLPVITARSAGGAELVKESCGFVLKDSNDVVGLAAAMQNMLTSDRTTMARAGRSVAEEHSWSGMANEYFKLFEECVATRIT